MSINFGSYYKQLNKMGYFLGSVWSYKKPSSYNSMTLTYDYSLPITTQCNVVLNLKYGGGLCTTISSCNTVNLKAKYCIGENTPIICSDTNHYGKNYFLKLK